jgi:hypothetical protein
MYAATTLPCTNKGSLTCLNPNSDLMSLIKIPTDKLPTFNAPGGLSFFQAFNPTFLITMANTYIVHKLACALPIYTGGWLTSIIAPSMLEHLPCYGNFD